MTRYRWDGDAFSDVSTVEMQIPYKYRQRDHWQERPAADTRITPALRSFQLAKDETPRKQLAHRRGWIWPTRIHGATGFAGHDWNRAGPSVHYKGV